MIALAAKKGELPASKGFNDCFSSEKWSASVIKGEQ
ncbi:hypothetical protein AJ85_10870 [Alkalihalobacillus alcalophilus ATCC 27647 = CGMCC 1.3604]|uniref:Uncharacterized protein n=1 Tax=Alkalihalobacillus alcalophilus ATCC 27647 = CGMCC 1.3604 TaxID=1218173 RepID=A0A4S4K301_ALKAL|nr:hypothetical protein AJ85_10870 [Alkalihalobacillus alcalophilus ATCC 27647 = CGMCC 1.3604]